MAALQKLVDLLSKADPVRCSYSLRSRATYDLCGLHWGRCAQNVKDRFFAVFHKAIISVVDVPADAGRSAASPLR